MRPKALDRSRPARPADAPFDQVSPNEWLLGTSPIPRRSVLHRWRRGRACGRPARHPVSTPILPDRLTWDGERIVTLVQLCTGRRRSRGAEGRCAATVAEAGRCSSRWRRWCRGVRLSCGGGCRGGRRGCRGFSSSGRWRGCRARPRPVRGGLACQMMSFQRRGAASCCGRVGIGCPLSRYSQRAKSRQSPGTPRAAAAVIVPGLGQRRAMGGVNRWPTGRSTDEFVADGAGRDGAGPAHDERHAGAGVVEHGALQHLAVIAQHRRTTSVSSVRPAASGPRMRPIS